MKTQCQQLKAIYVRRMKVKFTKSKIYEHILLKRYQKIKPEDRLNCVKKFDNS